MKYLEVCTHLQVLRSQHWTGSHSHPHLSALPICSYCIRDRALAPIPLIGRNGGSWYPKQSWKESGWGNGSPLTRAFAGSKPHACTCSPSPTSSHTVQALPWPGPDPRKRTTGGRVSGGAACLVLPRHAGRQPNALLFAHRPRPYHRPHAVWPQVTITLRLEGKVLTC